MTDMNYEVEIFDEKNVSPEVKRLATYFNMLSNAPQRVEDPAEKVAHSVYLYKKTTGKTSLPDLNADEHAYVRFQFLQIASKQSDDDAGYMVAMEIGPYSFAAMGERADKIYQEAVKLGVMK